MRLPPALVGTLEEIERLRKAKKLTKAKLADAAGITTQAMDRWRDGSSPGLDTLEMVAGALKVRLVVRFVDASDPRASVSESTRTGDSELTDDMMHLFRQIDELPDDQRLRVVGRIEGMISEMKSRPPEPTAQEKGQRGRSETK